MTSTLLMIFLQWFKPLHPHDTNHLQTFNECMTLLVLYHYLFFSDYVSDY